MVKINFVFENNYRWFSTIPHSRLQKLLSHFQLFSTIPSVQEIFDNNHGTSLRFLTTTVRTDKLMGEKIGWQQEIDVCTFSVELLNFFMMNWRQCMQNLENTYCGCIKIKWIYYAFWIGMLSWQRSPQTEFWVKKKLIYWFLPQLPTE